MMIRTLVRFLCFLLLSLAASLVCAQDVQPYPNAVTDRQVHPKTAMLPPPVNAVFADPDFGSLMVRVTDENTNPKHAHTYFRNPISEVNSWNSDGRKFFLVAGGGNTFAFGFDPASMAISPLPDAEAGGGFAVPLRTAPTFSFLDPDLMYGTESDAPLTIASYRFSTAAVTPLLDATTCGTRPALVKGPRVSSSDISTSADDNRIEINAGGGQPGNRTLLIVYDKKLGCRWYNTQTGQIGGEWGPIGQAVVPENFLINGAHISGSGQYVKVNVAYVGYYVWDVTSLDVQPCYLHVGPDCGGYGSLGYDTNINFAGASDEMNAFRRPLGDLVNLTELVNPLLLPHLWGMEIHSTWSGGHVDADVPVCGSSYSPNGITEIKQPYDGEIFCVETDGVASTIWRFAHNRAVWDPEYYWSEPFGNLSLDGHFFMFTSGWDGQVGATADGDPRSDVWIVKLG